MHLPSHAMGVMTRLKRGFPEHATLAFWAYIAAAVALGFVVPRITHGPLTFVVPALRVEPVTTFLLTVSSGMLAFTGIVFALMFIVLQFGSTAYSPHIVTILGRNRAFLSSGGVFTGTFLYTLMALRGVGDVGGGRTNALTVWIAYAWLSFSVYQLFRLVRVFASLEMTSVLYKLGNLAQEEIARVYPPYSAAAQQDAAQARAAEPRGTAAQTIPYVDGVEDLQYVLAIDAPRLLAVAQAADAVIRVPVAIGDPVSPGAPLAFVYSSGGVVSEAEARKAIKLGRDRSFEAGPKEDLRLLVNIALRALSPAVNDPTTAVRSLDHIEAFLSRLGCSHLDIGTVRDPAGTLRLVYATSTWEDYLDLCLAEIQQYGSRSVQVERRLGALFDWLLASVPSARRGAVERLAAQRKGTLRGAFEDVAVRGLAEPCDRQGLGHTLRGA